MSNFETQSICAFSLGNESSMLFLSRNVRSNSVWTWFYDEHVEIQDPSRIVMRSEESNKFLLNET